MIHTIYIIYTIVVIIIIFLKDNFLKLQL